MMVMIGRNAQPKRINSVTFLYLVSLYLYFRNISLLMKNPQNLDILRLEGYFLLVFFVEKRIDKTPCISLKFKCPI